MKTERIKAAVIGCGMISGIYLENLTKRFWIIELVACADKVEEKAKNTAEKYHLKQMTVKDIMDDPSIEMIINLTYASSHYEINKRSLLAGKHVYCEKMMAVTLKEADELMALAKSKGLYFSVAPDTILGAPLQTCRKILDAGLIGKPVMVTARLTRGYHMVKTDEDDAARKYSVMYPGGGIPFDMGGYYLHAFFLLLGPVKKAGGFCFTGNQDRPYANPRHSKHRDIFHVDTQNTLCASLEFRNGVHGSLSLTSECFGDENEIIIHGTQGLLYCGDPNSFSDKIYLKTRVSPKTEFPYVSPYTEDSRGIGAAETAWAIRKGRKHRLAPELGYHALEIVHALIDSTADGTVKTLKTDFQRPDPLPYLFYGKTADEDILVD